MKGSRITFFFLLYIFSFIFILFFYLYNHNSNLLPNHIVRSELRVSKKVGAASVIIIRLRNVDSHKMHLILQRKSLTYPVKLFAGNLNLIGGNAEANEPPRVTLIRELQEELGKALDELSPTWKAHVCPFAKWLISNDGTVFAGADSEGYQFVASVFILDLNVTNLFQYTIETKEGSAELHTVDDLLAKAHNISFAWGYDFVLGSLIALDMWKKSAAESCWPRIGLTVRSQNPFRYVPGVTVRYLEPL